jgi:hypothetical protein
MRPIFLRTVGSARWDVLLVDVAVAVAVAVFRVARRLVLPSVLGARVLMSLVTVVVTV